MERVVIVGAGLYGLIAAKTCLQVQGAYRNPKESHLASPPPGSIPVEFTESTPTCSVPACSLLVVDGASDIGGTWAEDRLYPNLLSQNSYGLYEYSDMSLAESVATEGEEPEQQFIPGWKINRYLHTWVGKWQLRDHIRLNWKVHTIRRHDAGEWSLRICITEASERYVEIFCDKLIVATGLTSIPHYPDMIKVSGDTKGAPRNIVHAKEVGTWSRQNLGYQPLDGNKPNAKHEDAPRRLKSVAIYGGAKSGFDLAHFFATLHRNDPALHLTYTHKEPVEVHWIIRDTGGGPSWMVPPESPLPTGEVVASDKASSMRIFHFLSPCSYEVPKRICYGAWNIYTQGSWLTRLFHGNPLGRWWIASFWNSIGTNLDQFAGYGTDPKVQKLRPSRSVSSCGATFGIANQPDLWEAIRSSHVHIHRSSIVSISEMQGYQTDVGSHKTNLILEDGTSIKELDLIVHATGYKPIVPIQFEPPSLRITLGISGVAKAKTTATTNNESHCTHVPLDPGVQDSLEKWRALDSELEPEVKQKLLGTGCEPVSRSSDRDIVDRMPIPYRLFRRMVAPDLVTAGDRSFVALGLLTTSTIAIVAEVQALWAVAFLMGELDDQDSFESSELRLDALSQEAMMRDISEDVVLGELTDSGLAVDPIEYNDVLLKDLGLRPYRFGGSFLKELTAVYQPSAYSGIVEEWLAKKRHV